MAVKFLEPSLCNLHQEEIIFVVIVKLLMMFMTEVAPQPPLFSKSSVRGPVYHVMLMQSFMREVC